MYVISNVYIKILKFDARGYVECKTNSNDGENVSILLNVPAPDYKFDLITERTNVHFKLNRFKTFKWLTNSK